MTFYVYKKYNVIEFFDGWIDFISGVGRNGVRQDYKSTAIGYRMSYPREYKSNISVTKVEKDLRDNQLQYTFVDAFPTSINSTPVTYAESDVMRYNVSFSYVRYVRERVNVSGLHVSPFDFGSATILGVVNMGNGLYRVDRLVDGRTVSTIQSSDPGGVSILPVF